MSIVSKELARQWKELPEKEKKVYQDRYQEEKKKYDEKMKKYKSPSKKQKTSKKKEKDAEELVELDSSSNDELSDNDYIEVLEDEYKNPGIAPNIKSYGFAVFVGEKEAKIAKAFEHQLFGTTSVLAHAWKSLQPSVRNEYYQRAYDIKIAFDKLEKEEVQNKK
jgi:hypothetical protein